MRRESDAEIAAALEAARQRKALAERAHKKALVEEYHAEQAEAKRSAQQQKRAAEREQRAAELARVSLLHDVLRIVLHA